MGSDRGLAAAVGLAGASLLPQSPIDAAPTRLVANLLDMIRVESGSLAVQKQWVPLEEVIGVALIRLDMTMSLDGYVTGPDDGPDAPLGIDGFRLFNWLDLRNEPGPSGRCTPRPWRPAP